MGPPYPEGVSDGLASPPAFPLVDDVAARALHLGVRSEVLFHVTADDGARLVSRRPWLRDAGATMRAFDEHAGELAGDQTQVRWRFTQVVLPVAGGFLGARLVIDWRSDTALICEAAGPTAAQVRRELDVLDEHYGPHRRYPPIRTAGRVVLWLSALGAAWLGSMREQQSTPTAHAVAVGTYLAVLLGMALLTAHVTRRALPPRVLAARRFRPAHVRATIGWAWTAVATVFLLRPPRDPYIEWPPGYWLALAAAVLYGLACLPRPQRRAPREGKPTPGPDPRWLDAPREAFTAPLRPGLEPERVVVPVDGGAVAAYWRTRSRVSVEENKWNVEDRTWPSDVGEVSAQLYDTWDGAPVRVVVARAYDRTVMVRSHDSHAPVDRARELTEAWFGAVRGVVGEEDASRAFEPRWTVALVIAWLCALTFVLGSDLGPSTYVWQWPVHFEVDHDYPLLAGSCVAGVVLAWVSTFAAVSALFGDRRTPREWRRKARLLAWQLVAVWLGAQVLTFTLMPRLVAIGPLAATGGWVVAVVNVVVVVVAIAVVLFIRPESPLGVAVGRRS